MEPTSQKAKYFEDYVVGEEYVSPGRTLTETDLIQFAAFSGDYNPIHTDEAYCQSHSTFKTRIIHGLLGLAIVEGLKFRVGHFEGTGIASLEWHWKFKLPMFIGDTVKVKWKVVEKRETKKPDRGIIREAVSLVNQKGEIVQEGEHVAMIKRRTS